MGDKNYKWWVGYAEDAEIFQGPHDTREDAIAAGHDEYPAGEYESFYVCEADKAVIRANIDGEAIAERVMEELCENNEECFGEDGPDDPWAHHKDAHRTLGNAIEKAVSDWLKDYPGKTWCFDHVRSGEYVATTEEAA